MEGAPILYWHVALAGGGNGYDYRAAFDEPKENTNGTSVRSPMRLVTEPRRLEPTLLDESNCRS